MVTFEELAVKFPVKFIPPFGLSIVVPGDEFNPDDEPILADQGCRIHFVDFDGKPVTLVEKGKAPTELESERIVYAPPEKGPRKLIPASTKLLRWTEDEDKLLIQLWNQKMNVPAIAARFRSRGRTQDGVKNRLGQLQQEGRIEPRLRKGQGKRHSEKVEKKEHQEKIPEVRTATEIKTSIPTEIPTHAPIEPPVKEDPVVTLLREIRDVLAPKLFNFDYHCRSCGGTGNAEDNKVWEFCPKCGRLLVIWNVEEDA